MSDERRPLTPQQHRAAALIGSGRQFKDVAQEAGVHAETISRWSKREDFQEVAERARKDLLADEPNATATLEAALGAVKSDGTPDWRVRVDAARTLIGRRGVGGGDPGKGVRETRIFIGSDGKDDGDTA
jgi:hypothetical protein